MRSLSVVALLVACSGEVESPTLSLEGPVRVNVDALGPVEGPSPVLSDGTSPEPVELSTVNAEVAAVEGDGIVAVGPGETEVRVAWKDQSAAWTLVVEPAVKLVVSDPPAEIPVGKSVPLHVEGRLGDRNVDPGELEWSSSDEAVATAENGLITGVAPGRVYVTVTAGRNEAMVELEVVE